MTIYSFSDFKITRGPNAGEIYFVGLTNTSLSLYHSTDHGFTSICKDSITDFGNICADLTPGYIYYRDFGGSIYISENYGEYGTWEYRNSGIKQQINSGRIEGEVYSSFSKHSNDYAQTFINHACSGYFGSRKDITIDQVNQNIGYVISYDYMVPDSLYLFISNDNFENLEVQKVFNYMNGEAISLSRGSNTGEVYLFNHTRDELLISYDFAANWSHINDFNIQTVYSFSMTGGRLVGELYFVYNYVSMAWQNAHTYIFHSLDYGKTFEVFHPFAKGYEPLYANFSALKNEVQLTTLVEFSNFSIGEITEYQWDFENDGIIDSYDKFPTHIYQDTGYYSVKLSVINQEDTNTFIKENYIQVIDTITGNPDLNYQEINIFPNPFYDKISIEIKPELNMIEIFDLNGVSHLAKTIDQGIKTKIINLKNLEKGIYILIIKTGEQNITKKIIKI